MESGGTETRRYIFIIIYFTEVHCKICFDKDTILCYYHQNPQHVILNGTKWSEESLLHIMRSFASLRMTGYHDLFNRAVVLKRKVWRGHFGKPDNWTSRLSGFPGFIQFTSRFLLQLLSIHLYAAFEFFQKYFSVAS